MTASDFLSLYLSLWEIDDTIRAHRQAWGMQNVHLI